MLPHPGEFVPVEDASHDVGRQHRHEIRGIGLDLAHPRRHQQGKGHEACPARHDIDEARQEPTGEEQKNFSDFQVGLAER